jgi:hypothetical protein
MAAMSGVGWGVGNQVRIWFPTPFPADEAISSLKKVGWTNRAGWSGIPFPWHA